MPAAVYILFGAAFTVGVSTAAGKLLLDPLGLPFDREEHHLFSFITGAALLSTLTFVLCAAHVARKGVFLAAGIAIVALAMRRRAARRPGMLPAIPGWMIVIAGVYFAVYFCNAMAPEASPDGSAYHLGLVARYMREHSFHRITTNMYANLSQGVEMLFLYAFAFGKHSAAALVHLAFLPALAWAMVLYGRRFDLGEAGICGALLVFVSPMIGIDGVSAYVDVAVAALAFAVFYLLEIWDAERSSALLIPIGLAAGFCYAAKYTAGVAVPLAAGFVLWRSRKWKPALTVLGCALAMMLPWLLKNWIWLGNPFSPFLNALFPNPYIQVGFEKEYAYSMRHYEYVKSYLELPWMVTVDGRLAGFLGPLFLAAPLGLFALGRRHGRRVLAAAAVFGGTYFLNVGARFLIPALPFVALAMAMVFARRRRLAAAIVLADAVFSFPGMTSLYCDPTAWRLKKFPVRAALRLQSEDSFLGANLSTYRVARLIESTVPPGKTVFSASQVAEAYTTRDILVGYESAWNQALTDVFWIPMVNNEALWKLEFRFPAEPLRRVRVVQTGAYSATDQWSISELRVFTGERELDRSPAWRLSARPNPFDIQLAFDNNPITRWRTFLPIEPGQFVTVDFGRPERIDRVVIECLKNQYKIRLKLEGQDTSGRWKALAGAPEESDAPPIAGLRRLAATTLKARGVDYLMLYGYDFGAEDLRTHRDEWGVTLAGELGDNRLYKICDSSSEWTGGNPPPAR